MTDDGYNLDSFSEEIAELKGWLSDGPKTASEFDRHWCDFEQMKRPQRAIWYDRDTPFLGSVTQGMGPFTHAGRLDLLQILCRRGEVRCYRENGEIVYALPGAGNDR